MKLIDKIMRYIKFQPTARCLLCGEMVKKQESYCISDTGDDFMCEKCDKFWREMQKTAKNESFNCFVGDIDVQKIVLDLIQELTNELAEVRANQISMMSSNLTPIRQMFLATTTTTQINDLEKRIKQLRIRLLLLTPCMDNHTNYEFESKIKRAKEYPIEIILEEFGIRVERTGIGGNSKCLCINHNEKTASMTIFAKDNHAYCFGCGYRADSISIYMRIYNVNFKKAVNRLNKLST